MLRTPQPDELHCKEVLLEDVPNVVALVAVVEEGGGLVQLVVEEDIYQVLVVTRRSTRLMLGVDCVLQLLPPLDDGGGRVVGGLRAQPAEEGLQY